jgi:hypothetical protein
VIQSPLEGILPQDHIFGTQLRYSPSGEIESLVSATAGFGKVAGLEQRFSLYFCLVWRICG